MATGGQGILDEAYARLHATGPEFSGWLSNHGPMAAEAIVRHGHGEIVSPWLDRYMRRLEEFPGGLFPVGADWQAALGDPRRIADWTAYFRAQLAEQPWRQVLNTWWPRLLPGVVAAATHGVIRVGHAVLVLLTDGADEIRVAELAHGLAYWAARWQTMPAAQAGAVAAARAAAARAEHALGAVPRIADQSGGIGDLLPRLAGLTGWPAQWRGTQEPGDPGQTRDWLTELVNAAVFRYLAFGHGNGVMLVHSATAPNAILRTLPALDAALWRPSLNAAWAASSALTAIYAPGSPAAPAPGPHPAAAGPAGGGQDADVSAAAFARAVEHGDEHVIKFADTAVEVFTRTGNPAAIAAAYRAAELIEA